MKFQQMIPSKTLALFAVLLAGLLTAGAQSGNLRFSASTYSIAESGAAATITVTRSGGSAGTLTVDFATKDSGGGTAAPDQDYFPTNGSLTFGPGVTSQHFVIPIIDDAAHEANETVLVELSGGSLGDVTFIEATLTIKDNDSCAYSLSTNAVTFTAAGGIADAIMVTATEGCNWNAVNTTANATWLGIVSEASETGGEVVLSCDPNSAATSRTAKLKIAGKVVTVTQLAPDVTAPTVTIITPAANARHTGDTIVVTGKAADKVGVTLVEARLENEAGISDYVPASGTANWSVSLGGLIPGTNTIRVRAYDAVNPPVEAVRSVVYVEVGALTLITNGVGSITPLSNGALLDIGKGYTVRAATDKAHLFTGWSGFIESTNNPFTFTMQTGFVLQANFRINPFIAVAGVYDGLCYNSETNRHASAGFLTVKSTELGAFSARLTIGGVRHSFSGSFAPDGRATNALASSGTNTLTVFLNVDLAGESDQIVGTISDGSWITPVLCNRVLFNKKTNPAPYAGKFTIVIPGDDSQAETEPGGFSFGTATVDAGGRVSLKMTLADGTKMTQGTTLSKDGYWPLYVPLYSGSGSVLSWVVFMESSEASFTGTLNWTKPAIATAKFYSAGFAVQHELAGSSYSAPTNTTDAVLKFDSGKVRFAAGNLADEFANDVSLLNNKVTNLGTNKLTLSINLASGLFNGSVTTPDGSRSFPFKGAVYQKQNQGWGFFLGTNQSGRVRFSD